MKIGLVTDSASDIRFEFAKENNIKITPLNVSFHGKEFKEDHNFDFDSYYENFKKEDIFEVKTAQPSPASFLKNYKKLIEEGYNSIICATISSGLSGTYNSAVIAAREIEDEYDMKVDVVDSRSASVSVVYLLELAIEMINNGRSHDEIVEQMRKRRFNISTILALPSLKYLKAGGRVSTPKFLIGRLLGLKPITKVNLETGENEAIATVRNMKNGAKKVYELTTDNNQKFADHYSITHTSQADEIVNLLVELIHENQPEMDVRITRSRSSISAHAGPGAIALIALFDD